MRRSATRPGARIPGHLLVRGPVHAHAYALALKKLTGVELEKFPPTPNIPLGVRSQSARSIWSRARTGASTRSAPRTIRSWPDLGGDGEAALPDDPPGELEVVEGALDGGKIHNLTGVPSAFTPDYAPEEMFEIASKLYKSRAEGNPRLTPAGGLAAASALAGQSRTSVRSALCHAGDGLWK